MPTFLVSAFVAAPERVTVVHAVLLPAAVPTLEPVIAAAVPALRVRIVAVTTTAVVQTFTVTVVEAVREREIRVAITAGASVRPCRRPVPRTAILIVGHAVSAFEAD